MTIEVKLRKKKKTNNAETVVDTSIMNRMVLW